LWGARERQLPSDARQHLSQNPSVSSHSLVQAQAAHLNTTRHPTHATSSAEDDALSLPPEAWRQYAQRLVCAGLSLSPSPPAALSRTSSILHSRVHALWKSARSARCRSSSAASLRSCSTVSASIAVDLPLGCVPEAPASWVCSCTAPARSRAPAAGCTHRVWS